MSFLSSNYSILIEDSNSVVIGELKGPTPKKLLACGGLKLMVTFISKMLTVTSAIYAAPDLMISCTSVGLKVATNMPKIDHGWCVYSFNGETIDTNLQFHNAMGGCYCVLQNSVGIL